MKLQNQDELESVVNTGHLGAISDVQVSKKKIFATMTPKFNIGLSVYTRKKTKLI